MKTNNDAKMKLIFPDILIHKGNSYLIYCNIYQVKVRGVTVLSVFACIARGQNRFFIRVSRKLIGYKTLTFHPLPRISYRVQVTISALV